MDGVGFNDEAMASILQSAKGQQVQWAIGHDQKSAPAADECLSGLQEQFIQLTGTPKQRFGGPS